MQNLLEELSNGDIRSDSTSWLLSDLFIAQHIAEFFQNYCEHWWLSESGSVFRLNFVVEVNRNLIKGYRTFIENNQVWRESEPFFCIGKFTNETVSQFLDRCRAILRNSLGTKKEGFRAVRVRISGKKQGA